MGVEAQNGREEQSGRGRDEAGKRKGPSWPRRGHPASWQHLPVTSWQGRGDGEARGERDVQDTGAFVYLIREEKKAASGPDSRGRVTSWPAGSLSEDGEHPGR